MDSKAIRCWERFYWDCKSDVGWWRKYESAITLGAGTSHHKQPCHRSASSKFGSSKFSSCLLFGLIFLYTVQPSSQYLEFISEPAPYYYTRPGFITIIPCQAVKIGPSGNQVPVGTLPYINNTLVDIYDPPQNHEIILESLLVTGMLVSPTLWSNSGSVYSCRVKSGDMELLSLNSTLYVADGEPLVPVELPFYMTDTGLSSITLFWGYAPVPDDDPLLGYIIKYWTSDNQAPVVMETFDNDTSIKLTSLKPGTDYMVAVQGRNLYGLGELTEPVTVSTMRGAVPSPPTQISVDVKKTDGFDIIVTISWMAVTVEPEIMTAVRDYLIYRSNIKSDPVLTATVSNITLKHTFKVLMLESRKYMFGVAARNFAGQSDITFSDEIYIDISARKIVVSSPVIGAIVAASILLVVASAIIFIIIIYMRLRMRSMEGLQTSSKSSSSPESRKKEKYSGSDSTEEESKNVTASTDCSLDCSSNVFIRVVEGREQIQMQNFNSINSRELDHLQTELESKN